MRRWADAPASGRSARLTQQLDACKPSGSGSLGPTAVTSRSGFSTKIHLKADLNGNPLDFHLTGDEASDATQFETSLDLGPDITPRVAITDRDMTAALTARRPGREGYANYPQEG
jgi:hypothetical protein